MKIALICVNYNSYESLSKYISSINVALRNTNIFLQIFIADNSTDKKIIDTIKDLHIIYHSFPNVGYFGAVKKVLQSNPNIIQEYDYLIISNVDLELDKDFFTSFLEMKFEDTVAWIAPRIYSKSECVDRNPKIIHRYTKKKLKLLKLMYDYPILSYLYEKLFFAKRAKRKNIAIKSGDSIYAGHGSFIILTKEFLQKNNGIDYPIFLFGEEIYLGERIYQLNMGVKYIPNLIVYDDDHVSTSKMQKKSYYNYNSEALKYIMESFYE